MNFENGVKKVLIDEHVRRLTEVSLTEEEQVEEAKALKAGVALANECQKLDNETKRIDNENKKYEEQKQFEKERFEFDKSKFEYQKQQDAEEKEWRQKEYEFKMDQFKFEVHKYDQEFEARREESKRNFWGNMFGIGVHAIMGALGLGLAHKQYKMSRVMEYKDACRETESMRECNKWIKEQTRKNM